MTERFATSPSSTVLVTGESGVGKDVVAHALHAHSPHADGPFLNITCSAVPESLLEAELFGFERGAFTDARQRKKGLLEQADGGTAFLDEIGEMAPRLQAKLLRFMDEHAFRRLGGTVDLRPNVRIVAATHRDLPRLVTAGEFRQDLYYRLAVLQLRVPPLRERVEDIELLAHFFIARFNIELGKRIRGIAPDALRLLAEHSFPGNVRELKNVIERAVLLASDDVLRARDIDLPSIALSQSALCELPADGIDLHRLERDLVAQALGRTHGNQTRAAKLLHLSRDQLRHRMHRYGLRVERV